MNNAWDVTWTCIDIMLPEPYKYVVIYNGKRYEVAELVPCNNGLEDYLWRTSYGTMGVGWYRYWMAIPEPSETERKDADVFAKINGEEW